MWAGLQNDNTIVALRAELILDATYAGGKSRKNTEK